MKRINLLIQMALIYLLLPVNAFAQPVFQDYFQPLTMRLDFFHTGNADSEIFALDRVLCDGIWAGSRSVLNDKLAFGPYFFEVIDLKSGNCIYSRGFANIFGEWQTTPEANRQYATFHESLRFPWPLNPVRIVVSKRDSHQEFFKVMEWEIDPNSRFVNPAVNASPYESWVVFESGDPSVKVDIVVLGDGYRYDQKDKFGMDVTRHIQALFEVEPFRSRKGDFNVRAVWTPCAEEGIHKPHPGIYRRTPLSLSYGAFDSERYVLGFDNRTLRDVASAVPYEFTFVLVNERTYGGGGIYNLYATVSADNRFSDYIFVHEFGHHFAALADEYYTSSVSYEAPAISVEPWEANITALKNPAELKWKHLVSKDTPVPTPWDKVEFDLFSYEIQKERKAIRSRNDPEEVMEALFERERKHETDMIARMKFTGKVGAFEGAGYNAYGMYRSETDCIMFTRNKQAFCAVCRDAIGKVIDQYTH